MDNSHVSSYFSMLLWTAFVSHCRKLCVVEAQAQSDFNTGSLCFVEDQSDLSTGSSCIVEDQSDSMKVRSGVLRTTLRSHCTSTCNVDNSPV